MHRAKGIWGKQSCHHFRGSGSEPARERATHQCVPWQWGFFGLITGAQLGNLFLKVLAVAGNAR